MKRILLAEDEVHISKLICFKLKRDGFQIKTVLNGKEALETLEKEPYDLLILDVMMPVMDGWEVLEVLRQKHFLAQKKELLVLLLTAKSQKEDLLKANVLGVQYFLKKPFDPEELSQKVQEIFQREEKKHDF